MNTHKHTHTHIYIYIYIYIYNKHIHAYVYILHIYRIKRQYRWKRWLHKSLVKDDFVRGKTWLYGIRRIVKKGFRIINLPKRKQFINLKNKKASMQKIECSVPQVSILGSILYLIQSLYVIFQIALLQFRQFIHKYTCRDKQIIQLVLWK